MIGLGFAYDLRDDYLALGYTCEDVAEFDHPETVDAITSALTGHGLAVDRIGNVRDLARRLVSGDRWDLVFTMAEGLHGRGREAQVPALLDAWEIPYVFSDPLTSALCLDKAMTKRVLRDHGLPTAPFVVVSEMGDLADVDLPFPLIAKPLCEGSSKGLSPASRVESREALHDLCRHLLTRYRQPALVEPYLPGREITVGITGTGRAATVLGALETLLGDDPVHLKHAFYTTRLADDPEGRRACELALSAWRALGCRDGGRVDLRSDAAGRPHIMEVNPVPGLHRVNSALPIICDKAGIPYAEMIERIVDSALERTGLSRGPAGHRRRRDAVGHGDRRTLDGVGLV